MKKVTDENTTKLYLKNDVDFMFKEVWDLNFRALETKFREKIQEIEMIIK